jgi:Memo-like protein
VLIERNWYELGAWRIDERGRCAACGVPCAGVLTGSRAAGAPAGYRCGCVSDSDVVDGGRMRPPAVAGMFYPSDGARPTTAVASFLSVASAERTAQALRGVIVPHAGYRCSGPIAALASLGQTRRASPPGESSA